MLCWISQTSGKAVRNMPLLKVRDCFPRIHPTVWVAPGAWVMGDVEIGEYSSVWFSAVVRGDVNAIRIGRYTNIQDGAVIHCTYQETETHLGNHVVVGHGAVLHGCTVEDEVLIGIRAVILDRAWVESGVIVAAGSVVPPGTRLKAGWIYGGVPVRPIKEVNSAEVRETIRNLAMRYTQYVQWYRDVPDHPGEEISRIG